MRIRTLVPLALTLFAPVVAQVAYAQEDEEGEEIPAEDAPPAEPAPPAQPAPPNQQKPPAESAPAEAAPGDEELTDEELGEENPSRPPPKGKGVLWGVLTDNKLKEPLPEAQVSVIGTKFKTITDVDGRFRLELPPGTYSLRFFYELHEPTRLNGVRVTAGQVEKLDVQLKADEEAVETIEVETEADRAALEGQTLTRQRSAAVGDSVGRAEIARTPDRNAAQAAQRVVGATIVGNRFVYVRGLGERYTNALLNGTPLPSPEPDVNAVPLDLFPALVLDSVTIAKTFTPDVPGDFAGGSVRIDTREIPGKFLFSPTISFGYNSQATFRDRLSYRGSSTDWLGFDNGSRALPSGLPNYRLTHNGPKPGNPNELITDAELERYGERVNSTMSSRRSFTPPNFNASVVVGDGFKWGNDQRLGYLVALNYSRAFLIRDEIYNEFRPKTTATDNRTYAYNFETGNDAVRWGTFASLTYQFAKGHRLILTGLRSQLADNTARTTSGLNDIAHTNVHQTRLLFVGRALNYGQLRGSHEFKKLNDAGLDWNLSLASASRNEPNTRDDVWESDPAARDTRYLYSGQTTQAGSHLYSDQSETAYGGGFDWSQPLASGPQETKVKLGGLFNLRKRDFTARRFNFEFTEPPLPFSDSPAYCSASGFRESCADNLFTKANVGPVIRLDESTQPTDAYNAKLNIFAAYLMADVGITKDLRLIGGERLEVTHQTIDPFDQLHTEHPKGATLDSTDALPAAALVYSPTKQAKMRASFTRTLARPQLRELAPFVYTEVVGGLNITGNPNLSLTRITNADLRFEYFPSLREVLAFSVFLKHFTDPIEPVIILAGGSNQLTYRNSPSANLIGVELEARKSLDFIQSKLKPLSAIANLTLAHSRIQQDENVGNIATNLSRPLVNQAPYVVNLALDYAGEAGTNVRVLYNVIGRRIVQVGTGGFDDFYAHPRHMIDLAVSQAFGKHWELKFTAENILNAPVLVTQGKEARDDNISRKYRDGSNYTLSAQYTY